MHSQETFDLLRDHPKAFLLLSYIALRARYQPGVHPTKGIGPRQAFIGDFRACGLQTEAEYRAAKKQLANDGLATFTGTTKGTIATLCNSDVYHVDVTSEARPEQHDNNGQNNRHTTTNLEYRSKNIENISTCSLSSSGELDLGDVQNSKPVSEPEKPKKQFHPATKEIIEYLNAKTGAKFRCGDANATFVSERLQEEGVEVQEVKKMIDRQCEMWLKDSDMSKFLRPSTLFNKTKFSGYYDTRDMPIPKPNANNGSFSKPNPRNFGIIAPANSSELLAAAARRRAAMP